MLRLCDLVTLEQQSVYVGIDIDVTSEEAYGAYQGDLQVPMFTLYYRAPWLHH